MSKFYHNFMDLTKSVYMVKNYIFIYKIGLLSLLLTFIHLDIVYLFKQGSSLGFNSDLYVKFI